MQHVQSFAEPHIEPLTAVDDDTPDERETLTAFSRGLLSCADAIRILRLRDYAGLLVALGDADLPMPAPSESEIEAQAAEFAELWRTT